MLRTCIPSVNAMQRCRPPLTRSLNALRCIYNIITLERVRRISDASRCEVTAVSDLDLQLRRLANEMLVILTKTTSRILNSMLISLDQQSLLLKSIATSYCGLYGSRSFRSGDFNLETAYSLYLEHIIYLNGENACAICCFKLHILGKIHVTS